jgi:hypothetical protein
MKMQDPTISSWGAQDRFQAHFIVKVDTSNTSKYVAKTILNTTGHFAEKKIVSVSWNGGLLAEELNKDTSLNELISKQSIHNATIFVDPAEGGVRIYGKWTNSHDFKITREVYAIYNKIAEYVRRI